MRNLDKIKTFDTPILFVVFNRPNITQRVFDEIRKIRPSKLYVAADGPRNNNVNDEKNCALTRKIFDDIDWPCEIYTLYQEKNLGCKYAVTAAFDWFFNNVEEGIILEDDDLPDQTFFQFCQEMLKEYRNDPRIMHISGVNFQGNNRELKLNDSYYFSRIPHIWGWASWRRAWQLNSVEVEKWPEMRGQRSLSKIFKDPAIAFFWGKKFQKYYEGKINSYDGQWVFTCLKYGGLCINPVTNLVSNIGFGANSTHTSSRSDFANLPTSSIKFPLKHPEKVEVNEIADNFTHKYAFDINKTLNQKIKWFLKFYFTKPYLLAKKYFYKLLLKKNIYDDTYLLSFFN